MEDKDKQIADLLREYEMFAHTTSHDLRDPLRQAIIYCDSLHEKELDSESMQLVDGVISSINEVLARVGTLRDYSYLVNYKANKTTVNCNDIIKKAIKELSDKISKYNADITYKNLPTINAEADHIQMVFYNLIDNAIKFNNSPTPDIEIKAEDKGSQWEFQIKDNGIGLDEVYRDLVFTIFQRLTPEVKDGSLGAGLTFCKRIVENHGGRIWFASDGENGTVFHFTLDK